MSDEYIDSIYRCDIKTDIPYERNLNTPLTEISRFLRTRRVTWGTYPQVGFTLFSVLSNP